MQPIRRACAVVGGLAMFLLGSAVAQAGGPRGDEAYRWKSVAIVGGGFVDGLVFHPTLPNLLYARTDMGGAYRREGASARWQPLLDWLPHADLNLMGVESIALDPSDPDRLYLACGTYTHSRVPDGAVLRSDDRGRSFRRTDLPVKFGGNEEGRGNGERLAVDPNDGRVLYLGTRLDGLWRSTDRAASFQRVESFPAAAWSRSPQDGPLPAGRGSDGRSTIVFVVFDPASAAPGGVSRTIYVGVSAVDRPNLWRSEDGGASWAPLPGAPTAYRPTRAAWAADGHLYVSYGNEPGPRRMSNGAVWKYDSRSQRWTDITPERPDASRRFGYAAVAVDARQPQRLLASTHGRAGGEELFRSSDGGVTWRPLFAAGAASARFDATLAPYVRDTHLHWLFDVRINPANPDHALFTTGYGGWETHDLGAADEGRPTHWRVMSTGIEEAVALALHSPTRGVPLVSAIGDYSGFVHTELDVPADGNPKPPFMGNTNDVTGAELAPEVIVRVGRPREGKALGYSLDGGRTWKEAAALPDPRARDGSIAVSADGATWVWTPRGLVPHVSRDHGARWAPVTGLPPDTRVVADRVNPRRFHALSLVGNRLYASDDAAASFTERALDLPDGPVRSSPPGEHNRTERGDNRGGQDRLYATPGRESELWLPAYHGLYHAAPGQGFRRLPGVTEVHGFGFGRAAPGSNEPALYLVGTVHGRYGIHRSTDGAAQWLRINDDAHQWGLILQVSGDPKLFGRVYVGTHGRGVLYGDPAR